MYTIAIHGQERLTNVVHEWSNVTVAFEASLKYAELFELLQTDHVTVSAPTILFF